MQRQFTKSAHGSYSQLSKCNLLLRLSRSYIGLPPSLPSLSSSALVSLSQRSPSCSRGDGRVQLCLLACQGFVLGYVFVPGPTLWTTAKLSRIDPAIVLLHVFD